MRDERVAVELAVSDAVGIEALLGDRFEPVEECRGLFTAVRFDEADDDVGSLGLELMRAVQHRVRFSRARCSTTA